MALSLLLPRPTASRVNSKDTLIPTIYWSLCIGNHKMGFSSHPPDQLRRASSHPPKLPLLPESVSYFSPPSPLPLTFALQRKSQSFTGNPTSVLVDPVVTEENEQRIVRLADDSLAHTNTHGSQRHSSQIQVLLTVINSSSNPTVIICC